MPDSALIPLLDTALRGGVVVLLLLLAALLLRDHGRSQAARIGAFFAAGVAAYAICAAPDVAPLRTWWHAPLLALASGNAVAFWLLARALFDDGFRVRAWHGAIWALFATGVLASFYGFGPPAIDVGLAVGRILFSLLAVIQTVADWRADLVERRRRLRVFITAAVAAYGAANGLSDLALWPGAGGTTVGAANALTLLILAAAIAWPLLRTGGAEIFAAPAPGGIAAPAPAPAAPAVDPRQLKALETLMREERIYRREGLTIAALADRMQMPEYRLRRLINQGLGHRNFNAYLNAWRIEEAKAALADPAQAEVPVLTIALDAGFQSLGPFNRAFKAATGVTPSEFRRVSLSLGGGDKPLAKKEDLETGKPA